ncbi:hypothetical protein M422DRAFT_263020 [Sphaerobolus stellatus SS14]|uniref:Uncharacterized protein n=1 Tax=Sphaerobolus stellatus (strain SS14) TaxID=990650 RepID=A0A0C9UZU3_SPHS4|nr:hypothetical protein M422DRAFT_263020 [Sphaerobolus stellatus SS14]
MPPRRPPGRPADAHETLALTAHAMRHQSQPTPNSAQPDSSAPSRVSPAPPSSSTSTETSASTIAGLEVLLREIRLSKRHFGLGFNRLLDVEDGVLALISVERDKLAAEDEEEPVFEKLGKRKRGKSRGSITPDSPGSVWMAGRAWTTFSTVTDESGLMGSASKERRRTTRASSIDLFAIWYIWLMDDDLEQWIGELYHGKALIEQPLTWLLRNANIQDDADISSLSSHASSESVMGSGYYAGKGLVRMGRPLWKATAQFIIRRRVDYYFRFNNFFWMGRKFYVTDPCQWQFVEERVEIIYLTKSLIRQIKEIFGKETLEYWIWLERYWIDWVPMFVGLPIMLYIASPSLLLQLFSQTETDFYRLPPHIRLSFSLLPWSFIKKWFDKRSHKLYMLRQKQLEERASYTLPMLQLPSVDLSNIWSGADEGASSRLEEVL